MSVMQAGLALGTFLMLFGGVLIGLGKVLQKVDLLTDTVKELKVDVKYMYEKMFNSQERISIVESRMKSTKRAS